MSKVKDWKKYAPYFKQEEFRCKETGEDGISEEFMDALLAVRIGTGISMVINSGYRSPRHSIERAKKKPGEHSNGDSADIRVNGQQAHQIIEWIIKNDSPLRRWGIQQKSGAPLGSRFLHLGLGGHGLPEDVLWSY